MSTDTATGALLEVQDMHAHYGKSHVLHGVDLHIARNEVVSLVGRNGSGRSTTMKAIMGLVVPTRGRVRLQGRDLAGSRPYAICRAGISYVPEERDVFANLTVDENLLMGVQPPPSCIYMRATPATAAPRPIPRCSTHSFRAFVTPRTP